MSELAALDTALLKLLEQCSPAQSRAALREIMQTLQKQNRQRIINQISPDGTAFAPRKSQIPKKGQIRKRAGSPMFQKIRNMTKVQVSSITGTLDFNGRASRLAQVHHFGMVDRVRSGLNVTYAARELLGISESDQKIVREILFKHLSI